jgi:hypothetical protein
VKEKLIPIDAQITAQKFENKKPRQYLSSITTESKDKELAEMSDDREFKSLLLKMSTTSLKIRINR